MKPLFWLIFIFPFFIQAQNFDIKKLGIEHEISNNYVVSITQDKKGFLWFATESGLNRFDGNKFKVYKKNNPLATNCISGNELNKVYADAYDNLVWIATQREGLNMFDCNTETFTHYRHDANNPSGIVTDDITDIINSKDGNLWISTFYRGIEYFNKKNKAFEHYNKVTIRNMVSDNVWSVNEDNRGFLYIGHVTSGLSVLSLKDKRIKNFRHNPLDNNSLPGDEVRTIYIDKNDNIWVGTNNGLALFNREKESFIVFRHNAQNNKSLLSNYIFTINQLHDGKLWIGTEKGGISILDINQSMFLIPQNVSFNNITYSDDNRGVSNRTIRSIYQDSFKNIWVATYGGGVNFISHHPPYFNTWAYSPVPTLDNILTYPIAWGMCTDENDRIWVGTDGGGINVFENGERIQIIDNKNNKLTDDAILAAIRDSNNNLWFGTFRGGINIFNPKNKAISQFLIDGESIDIRCFYEDNEKNMWIGYSNGLYRYNIETNKGQLFSKKNSELPNNLVRAVSRDNDGQIWIGFFGEGLVILDKNMKTVRRLKIEEGLPSNTVNHIYKDKKGQMWIATGEGLVCFKTPLNPREYIVFNEKDGLNNAHIRALTEDSDGNIWLSTNGGISRFIAEGSKFYNYNRYHGVPLGEFMSGSVTKDSKGKIFFGSQNGVCYFDPKSIPTHIDLPPIIITNFKVYNNQLKLSENEIDMPITSTIKLDYNQNTFSISFNVLDYALNQLVDYTYMLKGLENLWYNTQGENSITFRNIPSGTYELLIKSRIKNQEWTGDITSLKIIIKPPLWLTWWAKTCYSIIILAIIFLIIRFYKRKLDLENSLTLEKRNHMQEQKLNDERLRFFTNITHELRTPLTLILGPLEDLHIDTGLSDKHSAKISLIYRSATRLLILINQILEFRKTETQNKKLSVSKSNLSQLIQEVGLKYKELNSNAKITFKIIIDTPDKKLCFDSDIITTILENLLSNAFKYTQEGNIILTLRDTKEKDIKYTEIEVRDTGRGISADSISKIFDRYYQAAGDRQVSGTGIGLALVYNLVSIHEGEIFVDSELGKGTCFRFRIKSDNVYPNALHMDTKPRDILERNLEKDTASGTNSKQIILVIEDNRDILDYINNSLSEQYIIYTAINGRDGLEKAYAYIPDIIISDIMMPEMDGFQLSRILKEDVRTSHIPIIILTAKDSIQDRTEGYTIGVESYITKPFSANLLQSRIFNLLEARRKQAEMINKNTTNKNAIIVDSLNKIDNEFIAKITSIIEENLDSDKIDVAFIADKMNMSHSTLYRKVKALSGISVNEFIRKIRISNAEQLLLTGKYTITEIAYMVGINSMTYFRLCFKEEFGMPPSEYIKQIINNTNQ
ncbi:two component regulator with propeller domain [Dysgonomonas alginatilytica]|uniref:histidine kinase n=1 Tax=Dysgonomonas alginatilytica TaxID=1605892 RepID=A0A2V3PY70_9BACT|nr:hybrid sensor histidine kinase/response regulator transcription factor [Dysgonomonas alginatilytica]PXV66356.1 two component regulator with propeller domain [Dysgonomonas alginatilytica]